MTKEAHKIEEKVAVPAKAPVPEKESVVVPDHRGRLANDRNAV
jgi:hypothetical protein